MVQTRQHRACKLYVGEHRAVRDHDTLGEAGSTRCIVDYRKLVGRVLIVVYIIGSERIRILPSKKFIEVLARCDYILVPCIEKLEGIDLDDGMKVRHFGLGESFPDDIVHKEDLCLGVVHQMVDIAGLELMEKRHRDCAVCHCGEEGHSPVCLVARTESHLVALLQSALFKHDVHLLNPAGHIPVMKGNALIV